jgi:hypothetical protein
MFVLFVWCCGTGIRSGLVVLALRLVAHLVTPVRQLAWVSSGATPCHCSSTGCKQLVQGPVCVHACIKL